MKKYLALILALVMALSLAACGGSSGSSAKTDSKSDSAELPTLRVAAMPLSLRNSHTRSTEARVLQ